MAYNYRFPTRTMFSINSEFGRKGIFRWGKTVPVTWSDEKLILLYCPGRGSNSRPPAHRSFKNGQGVLRPYPLGHGGGSHGYTRYRLRNEVSLQSVASRRTRGPIDNIDLLWRPCLACHKSYTVVFRMLRVFRILYNTLFSREEIFAQNQNSRK